MIKFERRNLLQPFVDLGKFDVIFCRNVAIYFSEADKIDLFSRLGEALYDNGGLFLGAGEFIPGFNDTLLTRNTGRTVWYQRAVRATFRSSLLLPA